MKREEQHLQQQVVRYLDLALPSLIWFHCPNGGGRTPVEGAILKSMGVRAGVPDLVFVLPDGRAAFIELKAGKGVLTPAQKAFRANCEQQRIPHAVCTSLAEVQGTLDAWGLHTRARVAA